MAEHDHCCGRETITVEKMELDEDGFPQPTGEFETMPADSVVLALGRDVDLDLLNRLPVPSSAASFRSMPIRRPSPACLPAVTWSAASAR